MFLKIGPTIGLNVNGFHCPNETLCTDGELVRVGFMAPDDVSAYLRELEQQGLTSFREGLKKEVDVAVVDQLSGFTAPCEWAELILFDWEGDPDRPLAACRLAHFTTGKLAVPPGWAYAGSLTQSACVIRSGHVPEFMDFLRQEDGVDVFLDLQTGNEVFLGRTERDTRPTFDIRRGPEDTDPAKLEACRAYARMANTLDYSPLEP